MIRNWLRRWLGIDEQQQQVWDLQKDFHEMPEMPQNFAVLDQAHQNSLRKIEGRLAAIEALKYGDGTLVALAADLADRKAREAQERRDRSAAAIREMTYEDYLLQKGGKQ